MRAGEKTVEEKEQEQEEEEEEEEEDGVEEEEEEEEETAKPAQAEMLEFCDRQQPDSEKEEEGKIGMGAWERLAHAKLLARNAEHLDLTWMKPLTPP